MFSTKKSYLVVAALSLACSAFAAPVVTFVQQNSNTNGVMPENVINARTAFLGGISTDGLSQYSYGFEDRVGGDNAAAIGAIGFDGGSAGIIRATIAGDGQVRDIPVGGRYNTTTGGRNYWEAKAGASGGNTAGNFSISFDKGVSAFSFYATDVGDFEGAMQLILTPVGGGADVTLDIGNANPASNGNIFFFGFTDLTTAYSKVKFLTLGTSNVSDFFGFDDFTVFDRSQIIVTTNTPEPGSLALVGLALLAAGGIMRKRKAA